MLHIVNEKSVIIIVTIANTNGQGRAVGLLYMYVSVCVSMCVHKWTNVKSEGVFKVSGSHVYFMS